ncbi:MAG: RNA polymerase sigma factor [Planctomycetota bacterium]|jgi:RNA polymerase sigma-70 factor (ECF subfamily)
MSNLESHIELIEKARRGNKGATDRLAEVAAVRLREYVLRLTLDKDLTEDIVQESMLEMLRVFDKLKQAERFWSWLYAIAYNKVREHRRGRSHRKATSLSAVGAGIADESKREAFAETVSGELKHIVLKAMAELKPRQRDVLTMRCYDRMPYEQIAEVMGCSKFGAQALFYRAKKSFAKRLSSHGLDKGYLLAALVLFGKLTASSEAAAAQVSVTAATLEIGRAASLAAIATSKTAVVTLAGAAFIAGGSVAIGPSTVESHNGHSPASNQPAIAAGRTSDIAEVEESWYYYPDGPGGAVMMRLSESDGGRGDRRFRILQNQHGNYRYENGCIYMDNHHPYNADLSVRRLPTDDNTLSAFLSQIEGARGDMEYIRATGRGLLVICKRDNALGDRIWRVDRHSNVLDEVFFQLDWPEGTRKVDRRDAMHKRGWTYFKVSGRINGEQITGTGRIPFVYETSRSHYPWADVRVGKRLRIVDTGRAVHVYDAAGKITGSYAAGSFFDALGNPWMGLHAIDAVRRAAAKAKIPFETKRTDKNKVQITLTGQGANLAYDINLEKDVVESIKAVHAGTAESDAIATVNFDYLEKIPPSDTRFGAPKPATTGPIRRELGVMWLVDMLGWMQ